MRRFFIIAITLLLAVLILYNYGFLFNYIIVLILDLTFLLLPLIIPITILLSLLQIIKKTQKFDITLQVLYTLIFLVFIYSYCNNLSTWLLTKDPILNSRLPVLISTCLIIYFSVVKKRLFPLLPFTIVSLSLLISFIILIRG